jgi:hypothetical protein
MNTERWLQEIRTASIKLLKYMTKGRRRRGWGRER